MVDLTAAPYNLSAADIEWVRTTIAQMSDEEKIGQLFVNMGASRSEEYLTGVLENYHIGAVRYNPGTAEEVWEQNHILQTKSRIPLLIAANTEAGGNGACTDGTYVGYEVKIGATNNAQWAYEMGRISGVEASAIGCNWSFAPIVDIMRNWRNPIISNRSFSSDPDQVLELSLAYMKGIMESGILPAAKHFPGDGLDERDQHLSASVNHYSVQEWDATFGKVYKGLIDAGLPSIMAGHIMQPAYQRHFNPGMSDDDLLPATLSHEILTDLLRGKLGFNGVVVTDASHMVGLTGAMARKDLLPAAIAAGCDMFLFFNDPDEDMAWMLEGYRSGVITEERLTEALTRILGLKARLGLHRTPREEILPPKEEALACIGLPENTAVARQVADHAITLVKSKQAGVLPISPTSHKRVLVVAVSGPRNPISKAFGGGGEAGHPADAVAELLRQRGYEVERHESLLDKLEAMTPEEQATAVKNVYSGKAPIASLTDRCDLVLLVSKIDGMMQPTERVMWPATKGTVDIPWYVFEVPTIYVSTATPYALVDVPQVKTYINTYDDKPFTLEALVDKLEGASEFTGVSPVDAFCGKIDTRI
ncbi:beta-N-acetylhexosaminidase [Arcanobacterium wilhelmae]|uniref:beta-N-acetylhexosaminidase n=1 Tax=Arcanobacterium wilhelmae TaxID=1803177 RepID=A0ABT9NC95_9ACTO|nr:glycoside hydrolase family 3 N-terminal domain-containing protein [Arcanobacterium wilhelmae]MDP9801338.1 beta-N-acetylhexosaminidase [Arcanobacterium wilhelmae]WFN90676.1 glycoside hydrolase family 3 N-terminal domain-containing protein [Arcanobacterium wilhelmae]